MALEHVSQGQTRTFTPGVGPDARGILLGKFGVIAFATLERLVSWFRIYAAEASLDELLPAMTIYKAASSLGGRDILLQVPAISSHMMDRAARVARMLGAQVYTGTATHFVKYRDERSPFGYDVVELQPVRHADVVLHGDASELAYTYEGQLAFDKLLFRLALRRLPGALRLGEAEREELLLVVERGLAEGIIRYFWRNRVSARAGLFQPPQRSLFRATGAAAYFLFSVKALPARMLKLFAETPGVTLFVPQGPTVAIAAGYQHPISLAACQSIFSPQQMYLFWPDERVDVLPGPLALIDIAELTQISLRVDEAVPQSLSAERPDPLALPFRLVPATDVQGRPVATLVPMAQAAWLKQLLFALPATLLRGQRVAICEQGILVITEAALGGRAGDAFGVLPLGQPLRLLGPGILAPLGVEVVPRVSPDVLARAVGHSPTHVTVLRADGQSFRVLAQALVPLERRAVANFEPPLSEAVSGELAEAAVPRVRNEAVGFFALWGFGGDDDTKALPSPTTSSSEG